MREQRNAGACIRATIDAVRCVSMTIEPIRARAHPMRDANHARDASLPIGMRISARPHQRSATAC
ncbi:hypothetical protein DIE11_01585 [Burkholderia sp. Bp9012]|nr:hypothetical protein DIE11_01585 [Burkholderia sp. Bp9012]